MYISGMYTIVMKSRRKNFYYYYFENGKSLDEISEMYNTSVPIVRKMINRYIKENNLPDKIKRTKQKNGYKSIMINGKKIPLHRYVYTQYFGEIPENCIIHHIDCNPSNNDITNLQCVTQKMHMFIHDMVYEVERRNKRGF